jgi:cellulose biosynthesis protein BcsQ
MKTIAITGDKGGVGKSTISGLLAQWFEYKNYTVNILDADPNRTISTWLEKCKNNNYDFCTTKDSEVLLIDTAGTAGSSLIRYVREANAIIVPFQPHIADLEIVIGWFLSINEALQEKVIFIPNRKEGTNEQKEGILQISKIIQEQGRGILLNGLSNRPAVYPNLLNGLTENYFHSLKDKKAIEEINNDFSVIQKILYGLK